MSWFLTRITKEQADRYNAICLANEEQRRMADWNRYERTVRRSELTSLRQAVEALRSKARGHQDDVGNRRAYTRVLGQIDNRLEELNDD